MTESHEKPVRLMTFNIHRWAGRDQQLDIERLAAVVEDSGADVLGLNEVLHPVTANGHTYAPLAQLAERLAMWFAFGPSGWLDQGPGWQGPVGNALLSRFPLVDVTNSWLPRLPGSKQRSLLGGTLGAGAAAGVTAYVTHLDHAFEGTRLHQVNGVINRINHPGPHFLVGDFNTPGFLGSYTRRLIPPVLQRMKQAGYQDAFSAVGQGHGRTFPSNSPLFRIDFLFFPHRWAQGLLAARTVRSVAADHASDHCPLLVEWAWPGRARAGAGPA